MTAFAYHPAIWHDFFALVGGGYASILGLIFVSVSIRAADIAGHPERRARARGALTSLAAVLVGCVLGAIPEQPVAWLGGELVILNLGVLGLLTHLIHPVWMAGLPLTHPVYRRWLLSIVLTSAGALAGVGLMTGGGGGLLWFAVQAAGTVPFTIFSAWRLMVLIAEPSPAARPATTGGAGERQ